MSLTRLLTVLTVSLLSYSTQAFETAVKPHAMLYVSIPLDGNTHDRDDINYGFRLDNVVYTPGEPVNYQQQLQGTAVLDFRMDERGVDGFYISGTNYLQLYRVSRQNEDQGSETAAADADTTSAEAEEDVDDGLTVGDRVRGVIADMRATAPMGVYMGIGLGIGLLLGVDD